MTLCFGFVFFFYSCLVAFGMPQMDYTLYGRVKVRGKALTKSDADYTITIEIDGVELARYVMGSSQSYKNYYVLKVPMDSDPQVSNKAHKGDTAQIFVNGYRVGENPFTIGNPGETVLINISVR